MPEPRTARLLVIRWAGRPIGSSAYSVVVRTPRGAQLYRHAETLVEALNPLVEACFEAGADQIEMRHLGLAEGSQGFCPITAGISADLPVGALCQQAWRHAWPK